MRSFLLFNYLSHSLSRYIGRTRNEHGFWFKHLY
jgi:hypothetical protein